MAISVKQLHPLYAAEITGMDLRVPGDETRAAVDAAMDRYAVVVIRDQRIDDDQQIAFTRGFGPLEVSSNVRSKFAGQTASARRAEIIYVSNLGENGAKLPKTDDRQLYQLANELWHTDSTFKKNPALYSMLSARIVPPDGADTEFVDTRAAYDALPAAMKERLEGLVAEHSVWHSRALHGGFQPSEAERQARPPEHYPLVRRHPRTGRTSLYIASHATHVVGWPVAEGEKLLAELMSFATQRQFVYRHQWRLGDLLIWDNRCTMHRATPYDSDSHARDMRRTTVVDKAIASSRQDAPRRELVS